MTRHPLIAEWQQRLARLNRLIEAGARSSWRYEIRAKILRYFISRYSRQPSAMHTPARSQADHVAQHSYFTVGTAHRRGAATKTPEMIHALLEDIHRTVNHRRGKSD